MTEEQKAKLHAAVNDPTSLMPESVQRVVKNAEQYKEQAIASLPISDAQKAQLSATVNSVKEKVIKRVVHSPVISVVDSESVEDAPIQLTLTPHDTTEPHITVIHTPIVTEEASSADSR
jgi:hypothetical protein